MKIKKSIFGIVNKTIVLLLGLLGFSCDPDNMNAEYGTPNADFVVKGNVVSERTSEVISNIKVSMSGVSKTTTNGEYNVKVNDFPESKTFVVQFRDIDGSLNGEFEDLDTLIEFKNPEFTNGDGSWYHGEIVKELNVELKPVDNGK